jgi:hypothetical protein
MDIKLSYLQIESLRKIIRFYIIRNIEKEESVKEKDYNNIIKAIQLEKYFNNIKMG